MCVLCGEFVSQPHWTERHVEDAARAPGAEPGDYHRERRRERIGRARLASEVLSYYGLKVEDWSGSKYLLRDRKGRQELVQDLGSLWPAAEKLSGRAPDPLDPALLESLDGRG
ncbi:MAG: hypothetical protein IN808_03340 [Rubrobacter sp.]|nr:hypothetical protein [Rubrobacter sp.]